jgi:hypothetical protein
MVLRTGTEILSKSFRATHFVTSKNEKKTSDTHQDESSRAKQDQENCDGGAEFGSHTCAKPAAF